MAAASSFTSTAAWRRRLARVLPLLPPLTLATAFTSLAYNYSVQARLRTEAQRLHTLRLQALRELRTALLAQGSFSPSATRIGRRRHGSGGATPALSAEDEEEQRELVRQLSRLGLDPADVGLAHLLPSSEVNGSSSTAGVSRTGWSDVLFGGPNSYRAAAAASAGIQQTESTADTIRRAVSSAFKDFQVLGNGGGGEDAKPSKEDEALERWLAEALQEDGQPPAPGNTAAAPDSPQALLSAEDQRPSVVSPTEGTPSAAPPLLPPRLNESTTQDPASHPTSAGLFSTDSASTSPPRGPVLI